MQYRHKCIKCPETYESDDADAYYCPKCDEVRLSVAREVDARMASTPRQEQRSGYQAFLDIQRKTGSKFVNIRDLGITL